MLAGYWFDIVHAQDITPLHDGCHSVLLAASKLAPYCHTAERPLQLDAGRNVLLSDGGKQSTKDAGGH